jgi:hypothetical protein
MSSLSYSSTFLIDIPLNTNLPYKQSEEDEEEDDDDDDDNDIEDENGDSCSDGEEEEDYDVKEIYGDSGNNDKESIGRIIKQKLVNTNNDDGGLDKIKVEEGASSDGSIKDESVAEKDEKKVTIERRNTRMNTRMGTAGLESAKLEGVFFFFLFAIRNISISRYDSEKHEY